MNEGWSDKNAAASGFDMEEEAVIEHNQLNKGWSAPVAAAFKRTLEEDAIIWESRNSKRSDLNCHFGLEIQINGNLEPGHYRIRDVINQYKDYRGCDSDNTLRNRLHRYFTGHFTAIQMESESRSKRKIRRRSTKRHPHFKAEHYATYIEEPHQIFRESLSALTMVLVTQINERKVAARLESRRRKAARKEAKRQRVAQKEAVRKAAARFEARRQKAARKEILRQKVARKEAERREAARLKAERMEAIARAKAYEDRQKKAIARSFEAWLEARATEARVLEMRKKRNQAMGGLAALVALGLLSLFIKTIPEHHEQDGILTEQRIEKVEVVKKSIPDPEPVLALEDQLPPICETLRRPEFLMMPTALPEPGEVLP